MANGKFYAYVHRKADTGEVFYVGKGCGNRAHVIKHRGAYWQRVADKHGVVVQIVQHFECEREAFHLECSLIAMYRTAGFQLVNLTDGGDGASGAVRSEETKRRISESGKGKRLGQRRTEETRERMRASATGRKMSPEAIAKTAAFHAGRKRSEGTRAKMSAALKGKPGPSFSEATLEKLRAAGIGRKHSDEARAKMSARAKGSTKRPQSEEHRAKIAQKRREYWERWRAEKAAIT